MSPDSPFDVIVKSGIHRSARCPIPLGLSRIGNGPQATIVISDLADDFMLERKTDRLILVATTAPIEVGGARVKPGRNRTCSETTQIRCGGIDFTIEVPARTASARRQRFGFVDRIFGFAGGVLLTASVSAVVLSRAAPSALPGTKPAAVAAAAGGPSAVSPALPRSDAAALAAALRRHLDAVGLFSVATTLQGDGSIEAAGEIAPGDEDTWRGVGRWFDGSAKGRVVLVDAVRVVAIAPPLAVKAVWAGKNPYVVDGAGERRFVGSVLPTGWTLDSINTQRVILKRGAHTVAVKF